MAEVQVVFPENQGLLRSPSSSIERRNLRSRDSAREVNSLHDWLIDQSEVIKERTASQRTDDTEEWTHHTSREESNATIQSRNSLILAENCHDEGVKFEEKGELERAVKYHSKAVDIKQDVLGNEHYSTGISLARLAAAHVKMEKEVEALVLYGEALSVVLEAPIDDELSTTEIFHEEGDIWEANGRTWTIKNGIKQNITKLDKAKKEYNMPLFCPKCKKIMKHHLEPQFYKIHKTCRRCVMLKEEEMKKNGTYDDYVKTIHNDEIDNKIQEYKDFVVDKLAESNQGLVSEAGDVEKWDGKLNKEKVDLHTAEVVKYLESLKK